MSQYVVTLDSYISGTPIISLFSSLPFMSVRAKYIVMKIHIKVFYENLCSGVYFKVHRTLVTYVKTR